MIYATTSPKKVPTKMTVPKITYGTTLAMFFLLSRNLINTCEVARTKRGIRSEHDDT